MIDYPSISSSRILYSQVSSLLLYQSIFNNSVGSAFLTLLQTLHQKELHHSNPRQVTSFDCSTAYGTWFKELAENQDSWGDYLTKQILFNENPFSKQIQRKPLEKLAPVIVDSVKNDLQILENLYNCSPEKISQWVQIAAQLAQPPIAWEVESYQKTFLTQSNNWHYQVTELATHYQKKGTGLVAQYWAFSWQQGKLHPVEQPDPIRTEELSGYQWQKETLLKNTEFLLAGYKALSVLLYGTRGSGKSSLVKSLVHKYGEQGLRLIEVNKQELKNLPNILEQLRDNQAQKFIIFVDDLSFEEDDESFKSLKVLLEGNITAKPQNVVIYATSNRRHLIKEEHQDRPNRISIQEVHAWDTVEEKLSFSDRFGLTLTFEPATQQEYLDIVHHLAKQAQLDCSQEKLDFQAKQWATRHNGRSGRTARQFIDFWQAELESKRKINH